MRYPFGLALLRPTRGLEFSQSAWSIEMAMLEAFRREVIDSNSLIRPMLRTWNMKIPDSFNHLGRMFMDTPAVYALIVEEDVVVPQDAIVAMLAMNVDIAHIRYNLKGGGPNRLSEIRTDEGELHTLATGCMLIRRKVFEVMPQPWFRTDLSPGTRHPGSSTPKPFLDLVENHLDYGGHDGFFTLSAIRAGFTAASVPDLRCQHLQVDTAGTAGVNDGCHRISEVA